jgi:hypothetical protein
MAAWGSFGSSLGGVELPNIGSGAQRTSDTGFGGDPYAVWSRPTGQAKMGTNMYFTPGPPGSAMWYDIENANKLEEQKQQLWADAQRRPWAVEDREAGFAHEFSRADQDFRNKIGLDLLSMWEGENNRRNQYELAELTGRQDYDRSLMQGSQGLLGNILSQGYIDDEQRARARGNYDQLLGLLPGAYQGLGMFDDAYGQLSSLASSGGMDWGRADSTYNAHIADLAKQGYTPDQIDRIVATQGQEVGDQYRASAEQTFNQALGGAGSPAAAAAIMAKSAGEVGKAKASARANAETEQARMKLAAAQSAAQLGQGMLALTGQAAGNKVQAASGLGGIAGGKYDALNRLLGLQGDVADQLAGIDMKTMPGFAAEIYRQAMANGFNPYGGEGYEPYGGGDGSGSWGQRLNENLPGWLQQIVNTGQIANEWQDIYQPDYQYDSRVRRLPTMGGVA